MTNEGQAKSAQEELSRASEELRVATGILAMGVPRIALTRAYFACFHAARGACHSKNLEAKSHQGVLVLFALHFVKPGLVAARASLLLARLQKYREEADYGEAFIVDDDAVRNEIEAAAAFVAEVRELLEAP